MWIAEDEKNRTNAAVGRAVGVTGMAVATWRDGRATPTPEKQRLLRALGVLWPREDPTPDALREGLEKASEAGREFRRMARAGA